jgi:HTH-type transcriptional regulator/antitoxin HipB
MRDDFEELVRSPQQMGHVFRRQRERLKINQTTLGEISGLRQATISHVETGRAGTKIETICTLLAAMDLELFVRPRTKGSAKDIEDIF